MLDDDELIARLVKERRVSRWMVKRLHIFTLGRPDVFSQATTTAYADRVASVAHGRRCQVTRPIWPLGH